LLEVSISGAQGVLFNITGGPTLGLFEVDEAAQIVKETADSEANIIFGTVIDERMGDEVSITVIATGFDSTKRREVSRGTEPSLTTAGLQSGRENRDYMRELEQQRSSAEGAQEDAEAEDQGRGAAAAATSGAAGAQEGARAPATREVEDLDIPAFLRRNR
jgi:cell division protein FtsZ